MPTNPFTDVWHFLTATTNDYLHQGNWRYLILALFLDRVSAAKSPTVGTVLINVVEIKSEDRICSTKFALPCSGSFQPRTASLLVSAATGQKRRFDSLPITSDLARSTDILGGSRHVAKVPEADVTH
jgi:hypothetical protein